MSDVDANDLDSGIHVHDIESPDAVPVLRSKIR
jgi:hypothetical protein